MDKGALGLTDAGSPQRRLTDREIRPMRSDDWPMVSAIFKEGIETGQATFQTGVPTWEEWDRAHLQTCRLVAVSGEDVLGWAAIAAVSTRPVYSGVVEVSVYVASAHRGRGVGRKILSALVTATEGDRRWTLQAGIFPENEASVSLHLSCGFRIVGIRRRVGCLHGVWRDALFLERRSEVTGV